MEKIDYLEHQMLILEARIGRIHVERNRLLGVTEEQAQTVRAEAKLTYGSDDVRIAPEAPVERVCDGYWVHAQVWVGDDLDG